MKKTALVLAAVMATGMILTACGGNKTADAPTTKAADTTTTAAAAEGETAAPAENGGAGLDLAVQIGPDPETVDPALNSAVDGGNMILHAFETLMSVDSENKIVPGQAESMEVSDDGLTYTFHLRKGLKWSDGTPLTANDFVYSWKRLADPNTAAPYAMDMLGYVKGYKEASEGNLDALGVSAPDDDTFVVEMASPCVYFSKLITHGSMVPVQQATIEANGDQWTLTPETYISNGPLKMIEWVPGSHITFAKNENYWNADKVTVNTLKFVLMEDSNAAYSAYQTGEVSMIKHVPTEEVPSLRGNEDFHVDPLMGTYYISFQTEKEPFNNPDVRMALSLAIDRTKADQIGMLATVMNCIYVSEIFRCAGMTTQILTPFECGSMTKLFSKDRANKYFEKGMVVFFAGGTGHPYFSTDTGIALRAIEMEADCILLAKAIDGVYDSDPKINPEAKKYDEISIQEVIDKQLGVIDLTASIMCMENRMPLAVFSLNEKDSIADAMQGKINGTIVTA